jgi:hypothetical protein
MENSQLCATSGDTQNRALYSHNFTIVRPGSAVSKKHHDVIRQRGNGESRQHPTQSPIFTNIQALRFMEVQAATPLPERSHAFGTRVVYHPPRRPQRCRCSPTPCSGT